MATETILVVDDDEVVITPVRAALESLGGYHVLAATHPFDALEVARQQSSVLDLALLDVEMPGMNGPELRHRLQEVFPGLRALFFSGYDPEYLRARGTLAAADQCFMKPFTAMTLLDHVRRALNPPPPRVPSNTDGERERYPSMNRWAIEKRLSDAVDRAVAEYRTAHCASIDSIDEVPTYIPPPDGQLRIQQAAERRKLAFQNYQRAVQRYRAFVSHGVLPED